MKFRVIFDIPPGCEKGTPLVSIVFPKLRNEMEKMKLNK